MKEERALCVSEMVRYLIELTCLSNYNELPETITWKKDKFEAWDQGLLSADGLNIASLYMFHLTRFAVETFGKDPFESLSKSESVENAFETFKFQVGFDDEGNLDTFYLLNTNQEAPESVESLCKMLAIFNDNTVDKGLHNIISYDNEAKTLDASKMVSGLVQFLCKDEAALYLAQERNYTFSGKDMYVCPISGANILNETKLEYAILNAEKLPEDLDINISKVGDMF